MGVKFCEGIILHLILVYLLYYNLTFSGVAQDMTIRMKFRAMKVHTSEELMFQKVEEFL